MTSLETLVDHSRKYEPRSPFSAVPGGAARVRWHDVAPLDLNGRWTVKNLLPDRGVTILASEWGFGKTFVAMELARCLMLGEDFAGHKIKKPGGVLWLAAEGEGELVPRLDGLRVDGRIPDGERLPFAWLASVPALLIEGAERQLVDVVTAVAADMRAMGHDLSLIVVDTLAAAAGFRDENDAAQAQRAIGVLNALGRAGGCVVLAIDHFGKSAESGVRGSSAKEASADATIVISGTRDPKTNIVRGRSLVKRKVRGGVAGVVADFDLRQVVLGMDEDGDSVSTAVVDWLGTATRSADTSRKGRTPDHSLFFASLDDALCDHGQAVSPYGNDGPTVRAVPVETHWAGYLDRCGDENPDTARKRYARHLKSCSDRQTVVVRDVDGVRWVWKA